MDDLSERVAAVERALTDGDGDLTALAEGAAAPERVAALEDDLAALQSDVADLEAATQAVRGYVGNVRSTNESVEQRADAALAAVESLEERIEALESNRPTAGGPSGQRSSPHTDQHDGQSHGSHEAGDHTDQGADEPRLTLSDEPDGAATATHDDGVCHVCGRGEPGGAAADGGPNTIGRSDAPGRSVTRQHADDSTAPGSTRDRSIGGVDPTAESHRVRIDDGGHGGGSSGESVDRVGGVEGQSDNRRREGTDAGLLDRVRELL